MSYQLAEIFKDTNSPYPNKKTAMEALGNQCVCYIESYKSWYRVNVTNWRLVSGVQWTFFTCLQTFLIILECPPSRK